MSSSASSPDAPHVSHSVPDDGTSWNGNRVMLCILAVCIASSVSMIILAGVTKKTWVLVIGVGVMAVAVGVMLYELNGLIGTEHDSYGE